MLGMKIPCDKNFMLTLRFDLFKRKNYMTWPETTDTGFPQTTDTGYPKTTKFMNNAFIPVFSKLIAFT